MIFPRGKKVVLATVTLFLLTGITARLYLSCNTNTEAIPEPRPVLSVQVTALSPQTLQTRILANGDIAAWQEVEIGTEIGELRLAEVHVEVSDRVRKGQVLATHVEDTVRAELALSQAVLVEAEAVLTEAVSNLQRAQSLKGSGAFSRQQTQRYETTEMVARAKWHAAQAQRDVQQLRLQQTHILAPDDGIVAARLISPGAVTNAGQTLFRLIRQGRLEWRASVAAAELESLKTGQRTLIHLPGGHTLEGRIRAIAPLVDATTRNGLVYVELVTSDLARVGMFAQGEFDTGVLEALTLPRSAVQIRDGFGYVHQVTDDGRITEMKVVLGRQADDRVEVLSGLAPDVPVVASGGAFLGNGDRVQVIDQVGQSKPDEQRLMPSNSPSTTAVRLP